MNTTNTLTLLKSQDQDHEWYPTTIPMILAVRRWIPEDASSIMDIGAVDVAMKYINYDSRICRIMCAC